MHYFSSLALGDFPVHRFIQCHSCTPFSTPCTERLIWVMSPETCYSRQDVISVLEIKACNLTIIIHSLIKLLLFPFETTTVHRRVPPSSRRCRRQDSRPYTAQDLVAVVERNLSEPGVLGRPRSQGGRSSAVSPSFHALEEVHPLASG